MVIARLMMTWQTQLVSDHHSFPDDSPVIVAFSCFFNLSYLPTQFLVHGIQYTPGT